MPEETPKPDSASQPTPDRAPINPLADRAFELHEAPELVEFFRRNGMSILISAALAISVFLGVSAYKNYHESARQKASAALFSSQSAEDLQKLIGDYGSTPAAPLAVLSLAQQHFDEGQYDMARHEYSDFQTRYPGHVRRSCPRAASNRRSSRSPARPRPRSSSTWPSTGASTRAWRSPSTTSSPRP